jgi:general secretion pathway protein E
MMAEVELVNALKDLGRVTEEQLSSAAKGKRSLSEELMRAGVINSDDVGEAYAELFCIPVEASPVSLPIPVEIQKHIPYAFAKRHLLVPLRMEEGTLHVAINDPLDLYPLDELRMLVSSPISPVFCPKEPLLALMHARYDKRSNKAVEGLSEMSDVSGAHSEGRIYDLLETADELSPIVKMLNLILLEAIQQGASDIHFEPYEGDLRIRYRIDGVLQNRHAPAPEYQQQLLTRVKVMAELDIAERRLPQDGRIKLRLGDREIDFRVSTIPVSGGERIVLRILDKGNVVLGLGSIGMPEKTLAVYQDLIQCPEGIILVTGPTGSGKTTTLYSTLYEISNDELNIMTVEDPVEYKLPGIAQIGVHAKIGMTFSTGLRHILRQDPDVVMVGEIRDEETANIAIQASLTGHLVLSTLHTNDAPAAITRLVDMGVEPYLLSSSVIGVLAQRLVRRLCPECRTESQLDESVRKKFGFNQSQIYEAVGCDACYGSGYRGRCGVYELMALEDSVRAQILKAPDAVRMRKVALEAGMATLHEHGMELVKQGITTVAEVLRVSRGA